MFEDTTVEIKFPQKRMTFTPNLPVTMRRLYALIGLLAGIAAMAIPSLELFERALLGIICVGMITSGVAGYCCVRGLIAWRTGRR
jgi:hypothetical protein